MLRESHRPGIEPATCKSQVQRPTAKPPWNTRTFLFLAALDVASYSLTALNYKVFTKMCPK